MSFFLKEQSKNLRLFWSFVKNKLPIAVPGDKELDQGPFPWVHCVFLKYHSIRNHPFPAERTGLQYHPTGPRPLQLPSSP